MDPTLVTAKHVDLRGGRLTIGSGACAGAKLAVGSAPVLVGRAERSALCLPDRGVSALHAELCATPRGVRVVDLGSKNGTWIAGARVAEVFLVEATTLLFGNVAAEFAPLEPERVKVTTSDRFGNLVGASLPMRRLFDQLSSAAPTDLTVLVEGDTGTGKELVARSLHRASARRDGPFVVLDCGAIAPGLAESILFGHERGAFTGAVARRSSPFLDANGGTLFLDEVGELPPDVQPKLLRALAERRVQRVGGRRYEPFDARIIAATRRDLVHDVNEGAFRSDLYFRLAQVRVHVPPLSRRVEDIPLLVREMGRGLGIRDLTQRVPKEAMARLVRYDWPGNVRELKNAVVAAVALATGRQRVDLAAELGASGLFQTSRISARGYHEAKRSALDRFERSYFAALLSETGDNVAEIARRAGLQRAHVRRYMTGHGLHVPRGPGRIRRG